MDETSFTLKPIGYLRSQKRQKSEAPRQTKRARAGREPQADVIQLNAGFNYEQALSDLEGFSHLWVIFIFHKARDWKPMIQPPRGIEKKVGVFASRSPYRPNPVGLSLVRLKKIKGRKIEIESSDLLDGTPILDLKPYVADADQAESASFGWMNFLKNPPLEISFSAKAKNQMELIEAHESGFSLREKIHQQLEYSPFQKTSKRVEKLNETRGLFSHRYWRIFFEVKNESLKILEINHDFENGHEKLRSDPKNGSTPVERSESDLYQNFRRKFPWKSFKIKPEADDLHPSKKHVAD